MLARMRGRGIGSFMRNAGEDQGLPIIWVATESITATTTVTTTI
jgi:hypothetical protein